MVWSLAEIRNASPQISGHNSFHRQNSGFLLKARATQNQFTSLNFGFSLHFADMSKGHEGLMTHESIRGYQVHIGTNTNNPSQYQRFTIAYNILLL
jgi:hypothetical protein